MSATKVLIGESFCSQQVIKLPEGSEEYIVPVRSSALIDGGDKAIGITFCDSGSGLDLTRGLEIWACACFKEKGSHVNKGITYAINSSLHLIAGEGVGKIGSTAQPCISKFAEDLFGFNLSPLIPENTYLIIELSFPFGEKLAERTSNRAFDVIEGLALIGTQAEIQASASPQQLQNALDLLKLRANASSFSGFLIFVIGENGFDLALQSGFARDSILKTGNWLGPLIVAAAQQEVQKLLLFGYHGKLIKLAGGIFHTHNHLADARLEILTSIAVSEDVPLSMIGAITNAQSMEAALTSLYAIDPLLVQRVWSRVAYEVEKRSILYLSRYLSTSMEIGSVLFDRQRKLRWAGPCGQKYLAFYKLGLQE